MEACGQHMDQEAADELPASSPDQCRRNCVAVLATFALLHTDQHARAVDVADLERNDFGDPQPGPLPALSADELIGAPLERIVGTTGTES
jgi:hypothetical protein